MSILKLESMDGTTFMENIYQAGKLTVAGLCGFLASKEWNTGSSCRLNNWISPEKKNNDQNEFLSSLAT